MSFEDWLLLVWGVILIGAALGVTLASRSRATRDDDRLPPFHVVQKRRETEREKQWERLEATFGRRDDSDGGYVAGSISEGEEERLTRRFFGKK